jgi:hypothetical protein
VLRERRLNVVLILSWNIADEVVLEHGYVRDWRDDLWWPCWR